MVIASTMLMPLSSASIVANQLIFDGSNKYRFCWVTSISLLFSFLNELLYIFYYPLATLRVENLKMLCKIIQHTTSRQ